MSIKFIFRLFQNRYKSILCQEEPNFLELVRYIHLNPLRAKAVSDLKQLDRYQYAGHSVLMDKKANDWQRESIGDIVAAGSLLCYWTVNDLGMSLSKLAQIFELSATAISKAVLRGKALAMDNDYQLDRRSLSLKVGNVP